MSTTFLPFPCAANAPPAQADAADVHLIAACAAVVLVAGSADRLP